jgi:hypothetical protein
MSITPNKFIADILISSQRLLLLAYAAERGTLRGWKF